MNSDSTDSSSEDNVWWKWLTGGWAIGALVFVLAIIVFYVEEDWRGTEAWTKAQADIAAHGESLDPNKLIPALIPDKENFGALPIFKVEPDFDPRYPGYSRTVALDKALDNVSLHISYSQDQKLKPEDLPYLGKWQRGEKADLPAIQKRLQELCQRELPSIKIPPNAKSTEMFGLLCPALADLRAANATHPDCRFEHNYITKLPWSIPLGITTGQLKVAKVLSYEEQLALLDNQPELAMSDFKVGWKIDSGLRKEPLLISGLVSMGVVAIQLGVITEGLAEHDWNDQQLADMDNDLGKIDYLTDYQLCLRGEATVFGIPIYDYLKKHRVFSPAILFGGMPPSSLGEKIRNFIFSCIVYLIPDGWFDQFKAEHTRLLLVEGVKIVDPIARRVFPARQEHLQRSIEDWKAVPLGSPLFSSGMDGISNSVKNFAYAQVHVDEARIVCRLERYRLAHGGYPDSLDALVPAYGSDLPRDMMDGQPYHYKLERDGTYLLYSVGWNQTDEGGLETSVNGYRSKDSPDWVWGNHPEMEKANKR
jgi:hypothetical protein